MYYFIITLWKVQVLPRGVREGIKKAQCHASPPHPWVQPVKDRREHSSGEASEEQKVGYLEELVFPGVKSV